MPAPSACASRRASNTAGARSITASANSRSSFASRSKSSSTTGSPSNRCFPSRAAVIACRSSSAKSAADRSATSSSNSAIICARSRPGRPVAATRSGLTVEDNAALIEPGLELGSPSYRDSVYEEIEGVLRTIGPSHGNGVWKSKLLINDRIADSIFQQIILRPEDYSVLATTNLNGDYISDAAAAQVGGLGIAPGANIGDGYAVFEATHGTAPKYADKDVIN